MLERVLANVLTSILGTYLHGINRDSVSFGAWSGLVELRGVALRAEALAVLFETLGMDLPVTVEAGFIGLLRLVVPWKTIGSTPVKIELEGVNIIARPVRDDGSDDSEIAKRERRIKNAKLNTDDAVREASWNMGSNNKTRRNTALSWFVSDQTLAKIVANIQVELHDLCLRFEDPCSNTIRPYAVAIHCKMLKAVTANDEWEEMYIKDLGAPRTRKLVIVEGFRMEWLPLQNRGYRTGREEASDNSKEDEVKYETYEELQQFFSKGSNVSKPDAECLISPINGSLRLDLLRADESALDNLDESNLPDARALVDVLFPDISMNLDEAQYANLVQTSLYFSKLSIRGYSPKTARERWVWAVEQLLPGFRARRAMEFAFSEPGIAKRRKNRLDYIDHRVALLKARRTGAEEPEASKDELQRLEDELAFDRIIRYRDLVDEKIVELSKTWTLPAAAAASERGTTMSSFWSMLGYSSKPAEESEQSADDEEADDEEADEVQGDSDPEAVAEKPDNEDPDNEDAEFKDASADAETAPDSSQTAEVVTKALASIPNIQLSFHLRRGSIRLVEGGYPGVRTPRVDLVMNDLVVGAKSYQSDGFVMEALLGSVEVWDIKNAVRLIYSRVPRSSAIESDEENAESKISSYPSDVPSALQAIRSGFEKNNLPLVDDEVEGQDYDASENLTDSVHDGEGGFYSTASASGLPKRQSLRSWANDTANYSTQSATHRVTNEEFFGKGRDGETDSLPYIMAFQIFKRQSTTADGSSSKKKRTHVVVAVGQLEAVVDGPKGSFLWAMKFWKPKGLKKDPIIAFLGAAAGARIAELRMELEEAVLADKLPVLVDALIRAPRFIVPGKTSNHSAIVVNMGTLGIRTSENETRSKIVSSFTGAKPLGNYSNYALSLDDLGMYIAPNEGVATSSTRELHEKEDTSPVAVEHDAESKVDLKLVERLIRPLSLRFIVQVLRDASSVHAASQSSSHLQTERISRLRLRGQVPGLWVILSQKACKHLVGTVKRWSKEALVPSRSLELAKSSSDDIQPFVGLDHKDAPSSNRQATKLASYDCRVAIEHVSLELQDENSHRLVTTVASGLSAAIVKTKHLCLESEFTLKSWTVTDGSRGSTAPFRRLVYAGTGSGVRGVSPPRSSTSSKHSRSPNRPEAPANDPNFVNIKHRLNFKNNEQTVNIHFLSLNLIFLRETVVKIASFLQGIRGSKPLFERTYSQGFGDGNHVQHDEPSASSTVHQGSPTSKTFSPISLTANFDGFFLELVSAKGSVASVEMRDFAMNSRRDSAGDIRSYGDVRYFSVDDLTASIREHQNLVRYEKPTSGEAVSAIPDDSSDFRNPANSDGWVLDFPRLSTGKVSFCTRLRGLHIRFLARFISVMSHYFSALSVSLRNSQVLSETEATALLEQGQEKTSELLASQTRSYSFEILSTDVTMVLPRHSANADEAMVFEVPTVQIHNLPEPNDGYKSRINVEMKDMQALIQYRIDGSDGDSFLYRTELLGKHSAELDLDLGDLTAKSESPSGAMEQKAASPYIQARFNIVDCVSVQMCEAQYSILYFVLTENLLERIEGDSMSLEVDGEQALSDVPPVSKNEPEPEANIDPATISDDDNARLKAARFALSFRIPKSTTVLSRGWNVINPDCRILEMRNRNLTGNVVYSQTGIVVEVAASVDTVADLRKEHAIGTRTFVLPLENVESSDGQDRENIENFSLAYTKVFGNRPNIEINLANLQTKVIPELLRDMSYLSIPGWPFLPSSDFAPLCAYLGRTITISVSNSQTLLYADEFAEDARGLVLSGHFVARLEWLKGTGAKLMSLSSTGLEIALENHLQHMSFDSNLNSNIAKRYSNRDHLILFPSDSRIEYIGPKVDEHGARARIEADSILCRINVQDAPSIFSVLRRLSRLNKTYLSSRDWKHPSVLDQYEKSGIPPPELANQENASTSKTMSVSYVSPASRLLFTDESDGRFIPVLELNLESVSLEGTIPSLAEVKMDISMNLFSREKGWWEPGLEPWSFRASLSRGASGTKAIVINSETFLNINVTPDTVNGAKELMNSLKSIKNKADRFAASARRKEDIESTDSNAAKAGGSTEESFGPSVAAFHVKNDLGLPVEVFIPVSTQKVRLDQSKELEVHLPVDRLLPSYRSVGQLNENITRHDTLRCQLTIAGHAPLDLSAAEVGSQSVSFHQVTAEATNGNVTNSVRKPLPVFAVWDVAMIQGVPLCTIRSPIQIVNRTDKIIELSLRSTVTTDEEGFLSHINDSELRLGDEDIERVLTPGATISVPLAAVERLISIRPQTNDERSASRSLLSEAADFNWSDTFNGWDWLKLANSSNQRRSRSGKWSASQGEVIEHEIVRCRSLSDVGFDFFLAVVPESFAEGPMLHGTRLDIAIQAPLSFTNKLPGRISYRISEAASSERGWDWDDGNTTILGTGFVAPLESAFVYCTDDTQNLSGISIAFENAPIEIPGRMIMQMSQMGDNEIPTRFGPFTPISSILSGETTSLPAAEPKATRLGKADMGLTAFVLKGNTRVPSFELFCPFWLRNRSDVDLDVCSRSSYYAKGSNVVLAPGYPKGIPAGRFLCFEGPYLALRSSEDVLSYSSSPSSQWWVSPSDLRETSEPVTVSVANKSLLMDVRPTRGFSNSSFTVTIRNAAFIINNSDRCIQWCQTSTLDGSGNCPFRHLRFLKPQEEAPIHWFGSKNLKSISIRLADENGHSDWLWSPALPILLGNAGEVSAKMYRPKTAEQYISRVQSSQLDGGALALMIISEDRLNPPYRIYNLSQSRSVAFRQVGAQERPWLVRPGRSTRYCWDDPIAPASRRRLQVDVLDSNAASSAGNFGGAGSSARTSLQQVDVNIDVVANELRSLGPSNLGLSYAVKMQGATKVVCFRDTGDESDFHVPASSPRSQVSDPEEIPEVAVPVVLWDDFKETGLSDLAPDRETPAVEKTEMLPALSDYPLKIKSKSNRTHFGSISMDSDAAFYLAGVGVSLITSDPVELLYIHATGLNAKFEAYDSLQCIYFDVKHFQIDNQLDNPPFPVAMWTGVTEAGSRAAASEGIEAKALKVEVKRVVTDSGILMLKSLMAAVQPLNLRVDEELIGRIISVVSEFTAVSKIGRSEILEGEDGEHLPILTHLESKFKRSSKVKQLKQSFKSAERIYVEYMHLFDTQIVLTSSIARGQSSRMLTHSALRPLMAFLMNVENCEFSFSALEVKHLFSSRSHFASLIRQFYSTQLSGQKIKLLASNSLVGNPAALFDSVAHGAKDFFTEPGKTKGFLVGFGRGSKSLITHTVGGIVGSISGIPKAMSSGLESAVGDDTYLAERERIRGSQLSGGRRIGSSNPAQGVVTGALSLAHGISSGVTGLIRDPVQGAMQGGASGFLKGVRKGLVGGIVKPVAGAMDLIAEPVSGVSKIINEGDSHLLRDVVPKRPPRTFWGESNRLVSFDVRSATGFALYRGVQINSGVSFPHALIDWVELSDRDGRKDPDGAEWVWSIVRERARAMARPRRGTKSSRVNIQQNTVQDVALQLRPEKTRVALLTFENILIVTLDCKLILTIPLWEEAIFSVEGYGKELVLLTKMAENARPGGGSSIIAETQALFAAPWDASSSARRRKPNPGELIRDRISCGSPSAREDLTNAILKLLEAKQKNSLRNYAWGPVLRRAPSAIELPELKASAEDGTELTQRRDRTPDFSRRLGRMSDLYRKRGQGSQSSSLTSRLRERVDRVVTSSPGSPSRRRELLRVDDSSVARIVELGFSPEASTYALRQTQGDLLEAINLLVSSEQSSRK